MKQLIIFGILFLIVLLILGCTGPKIECTTALDKEDCEKSGGTYVDGPEVSCMAIGCAPPRHCDCSNVD